MQSTDFEKTIVVDGRARSRYNSQGHLIDHTDEGLIKFWRWFNNSLAVDSKERPLVVYHGTNAMAYSNGDTIQSFRTDSRGGAFFSSELSIAKEYGESVYAAYVKTETTLVVFADGASWSNIDVRSRVKAVQTEQLTKEKHKTKIEADAILSGLFDDYEPSETVIDSNMSLDKLSDLPGLDTHSTETDLIVKGARRLGYDGVIIYDVIDSPTSDLLYSKSKSDIIVGMNSANIKSIHNYGNWNPESAYFLEEAVPSSAPEPFNTF